MIIAKKTRRMHRVVAIIVEQSVALDGAVDVLTIAELADRHFGIPAHDLGPLLQRAIRRDLLRRHPVVDLYLPTHLALHIHDRIPT